MNQLMSWSECTNKFLRKVSPDLQRCDSIIEMALRRHKFVNSLKVDEVNISFIFEGYYEVIKELLVALLLKNGLRSQNHQCLFTYFSREFDYEAEVHLIKQMNFLRNRLNYYGEEVDLEYFKENHKSFEKIISLLLNLVKT